MRSGYRVLCAWRRPPAAINRRARDAQGPVGEEGSQPMPSPFTPGANAIARAVVMTVPLSGAALFGGLYTFGTSSYFNGVGVVVDQPVQFSHAHHVAGL